MTDVVTSTHCILVLLRSIDVDNSEFQPGAFFDTTVLKALVQPTLEREHG